jgi:hypothetical protein
MQCGDLHNGFALHSIAGLYALKLIAFFTSMRIGIPLVVIPR